MARIKKLKPGLTESQILNQVLDALRAYGCDVDRRNTGGGFNPRGRYVRFGQPGDADISGMLPDGRKLDVEVKRPGKRPTEAQMERLRRTNQMGGVGFWCDSVDYVLTVLPLILAGGRMIEGADGVFDVSYESRR